MSVEILLSCMHQTGTDILSDSNLSHDTLIINQCDIDRAAIISLPNGIRRLDTPTRGLSVSRNLGIKHSTKEICVLSDDDEFFFDGITQKISREYDKLPDADVIVFSIENRKNKLGHRVRRLRLYEVFRVASWQISFRRKSIVDNRIQFDTNLGSGTNNGGGEENKFILDCIKNKLKVYYVPLTIARIRECGESKWFFGYNEEYFYRRGISTRYIFGLPIAILYGGYFILAKYNEYKESISVYKAIKSLFRGIKDNTIVRGKR